MLLPLDAFLAALEARVPRAGTILRPPFAALGLVAAADITSPRALPPAAVALRPGHAVRALDLVGASAHAPALLAELPPAVAIDEAMPPGTDAVLPPDAVMADGPFTEVTATPAPGEAVRLAGHDLAEGAVLALRGAVITPDMALAATLAGLAALPVSAPRIRLAAEGPAAIWLAARLEAAGVVEAEGTADLTLTFDLQLAPAVALEPGGAMRLDTAPDGSPHLILAPRFDAVAAAWAAVLLPLIAARTGRCLARETRPLAAKVASAVGFTGLVLLRRRGCDWQPLATGFITLETLLAAEAFTLWPATSEGAAAGTPVSATPLSAPLVPDTAP